MSSGSSSTDNCTRRPNEKALKSPFVNASAKLFSSLGRHCKLNLLFTLCNAAEHAMCTPRSGHFVVIFFLDNASVALLSVPPTTQTLRQSTAPGMGDSKKTKCLQRGQRRKQLCACRCPGGLTAPVKQKRHVTGQDFKGEPRSTRRVTVRT